MRRIIIHFDDLSRVNDLEASIIAAGARQFPLDPRSIAGQKKTGDVREFAEGEHRPVHERRRSVIMAHGIKGDPHPPIATLRRLIAASGKWRAWLLLIVILSEAAVPRMRDGRAVEGPRGSYRRSRCMRLARDQTNARRGFCSTPLVNSRGPSTASGPPSSRAGLRSG